MKTSQPLLALVTAVVLGFSSTGYADSKRTAEYLLTSPSSHQDSDVTVDVALVKPVHWVSPVADTSFFRVMTLDRSDRKFGGEILVAVPSSEAERFAKKYGTDFEGRYESDSLKGTFLSVGRKDARDGGRFWLIDTTGKLKDAIASQKLELPSDGSVAVENGGGVRGRRLGQR